MNEDRPIRVLKVWPCSRPYCEPQSDLGVRQTRKRRRSLLSDLFFRRFTQTRSAVVSVRVEGRVDRGADVSQVVGHLLADWKEKPTGLSAQAMPDSFVRRGKPFL